MNADDESQGRLRFDELAREAAPPPELEGRLVAELGRRGLLGRGTARVRRWRAAAAALLTFALGLWAGANRTGEHSALTKRGANVNGDEKRYLLLLYEPRPIDRRGLDLVKEYSAWAGGLARSGNLVAAEKLARSERRFGEVARLLGGAPGPVGPLTTETFGEPTGFFLIRAASQEEAERIALDCPHLKHGGEVSLRPVDPT